METEALDLQQLNFFTEGNTFTGGRTKDPEIGTLLRYLVKPDREKGELTAYAWNADLCFERAENKTEKSFPMTEEGLQEIQNWLQEQYRAI